MSYLSRIASRVSRPHTSQDGLPPNAVTVPTMKIQSPLVEADQRLSIPAFAEIGPGKNGVTRNAFDRIDDAPEGPQGEPVPLREVVLPEATIESIVPLVSTAVRVGTPEVSESATSLGAVKPWAAQAGKLRNSNFTANGAIEPCPLSEPEAAPNPASESRSSYARTGRQDILGALSAALSRVDSWMGSDTSDSSSAVAQTSSKPHQLRQTAGASATTGLTPALHLSTFHRVASRMAGLGEPNADSSSTVASGIEPAPRGDTGSALERVLAPAARVPSLPLEQARPSPNAAPNWSPTMTEPSVVSIGRIDVEVVPPPPSPVPIVSPNVANRAARSFRASVNCEGTQRPFGWRQS